MSVVAFVDCDTAHFAHTCSGEGFDAVGVGDGIVHGGHGRRGHNCQGNIHVAPCTSERNLPSLRLENRELDLMLTCSA